MRAELQNKNVILYRRVSTTDQKLNGHSLSTQNNNLREFARNNGMNVVREYMEDFSAKNFNRPEFRRMEEYVKNNKGKVDYILITNWDRFSRNIGDGLNVIYSMKALGVEINCTESWIDYNDPSHVLILSVYLAGPEVENKIKSQKVRVNMRQGLKEGRWNRAQPVGYIKGRDPQNPNRPLMQIDPIKGPLIAELFKEFAQGVYSQSEILRMPKYKSLKLSKSNLSRFLKNVLYAGKIKVPALKEEQEELVDALHKPLITWEIFQKVQYQLEQRSNNKSKPSKFNKELPLRGHLKCPECDGNLTGSGSTGKSGKRHYYYHCNTKNGCNVRFKVKDVHDAFDVLMRDLSPPAEVLHLFSLIMKDHYQDAEKTKYATIKSVQSKINSLEERKGKLLDKLLDNVVSNSVYTKNIAILDNEIMELEIQLEGLGDYQNDLEEYIKFGTFLLDNFSELYHRADVQTENKVLSSILGKKLTFTGKKYRTPKFKEAFSYIYMNVSKLENKSTKKGDFLSKASSMVEGLRLLSNLTTISSST
jgi:site-specific DNA recombinase